MIIYDNFDEIVNKHLNDGFSGVDDGHAYRNGIFIGTIAKVQALSETTGEVNINRKPLPEDQEYIDFEFLTVDKLIEQERERIWSELVNPLIDVCWGAQEQIKAIIFNKEKK